jgi:hypothetical protein
MDNDDDNKVVPLWKRLSDTRPLTGEEVEEQFLRGNANPAYMAQQMADVLRHLMRATAQKSGNISANIYHAASAWKVLVELCERCKEPWSWPRLFEAAVKELRAYDAGDDDLREAFREVARAGMSLYIEGNTGGVNKDHIFMDAIRHLEETRERHKKGAQRP